MLMRLSRGVNTPFAEVSLLGFVRDPNVCEYIRRAYGCSSVAIEERMLAFQYLRLGFETLVQGYQQSKSYHPGQSLITTKPCFLPAGSVIRDHAGEFGETVFEWLENLDSWVRILVLGIDVQGYTFFSAYTPGIVFTMDGRTYFGWLPYPSYLMKSFVVVAASRWSQRFGWDAELRLQRLECVPVFARRTTKHANQTCDGSRRERAVRPGRRP